MTSGEIQPIPEGARLVHIGFNKTGTTSIQGALKDARPKLPTHGVVYPGEERYHKRAGVHISGAVGRIGDRPVGEADWQELVDETNAAGDKRVVISSEWLCQSPEDSVRRVVEELGGDKVHIVATLRPLVKILPSSWQQFLQNGLRVDYDTWLRGMLLEPPYEKPTPTFWQRHTHDAIIERWAKIAGPDHVTAIVVDSRDHDKILRQFETLLALPDGLLVAEPPEKDNRSLTWPEAEMLRVVNDAFKRKKWPEELYRSAVRTGFVAALAHMRPSKGDNLTKIPMPTWAAERASEIGAGFAKNIAGLGINVVGDLESLGRMPSQTDESATPPAVIPSQMAGDALVAAIIGARQAGRREGKAGSVEAMTSSDGRHTIELGPGTTKALKRAQATAQGIKYRAQSLRKSPK
ncbi:MAG: hypothetical protein JO246_14995 [Frankiaceae bacterium]|nr:hypothetical protein [Frankiaceae bacterium]MBV9871603.1 hypothetical protein [Frankiaceae bacterium]